MNTRYAVWLDNHGLHDLDETILITDIQEANPRMRITTADNARYEGQRVIRHARQSLSVTVSFLIREYDAARRKALCTQVCAWAANGGWLTTSDRPGQQLQVLCESLPAASALHWTEPLSITFTAYEQPYWQDEHPILYPIDVAAGVESTLTLMPQGNAPYAFLEADITNTSPYTMTELSIRAGDTQFHLADAALLPVGEMLCIAYDRHGFLTIRSGSTSMLHARSAASSDDLLMVPGQACEAGVTCSQHAHAVLKARGLYL